MEDLSANSLRAEIYRARAVFEAALVNVFPQLIQTIQPQNSSLSQDPHFNNVVRTIEGWKKTSLQHTQQSHGSHTIGAIYNHVHGFAELLLDRAQDHRFSTIKHTGAELIDTLVLELNSRMDTNLDPAKTEKMRTAEKAERVLIADIYKTLLDVTRHKMAPSRISTNPHRGIA